MNCTTRVALEVSAFRCPKYITRMNAASEHQKLEDDSEAEDDTVNATRDQKKSTEKRKWTK